jgi:hypothetical protein
MMDDDGTFIGQLCHIEAAEPGGERFNPAMSNEERRGASNLMLMCYPHHRVTNNIPRFAADDLRAMKAKHEAKYSGPNRAMRERVANAKWATLVGAGLVTGAGFGDIIRGLKALLDHTESGGPLDAAKPTRGELLQRLRLAPTGVVRFYSRDPVHAAVGDRILELFQSAGWRLEQLDGVKLTPKVGSQASLDHAMLLAFEVPTESQTTNASKAIHGFFASLGFIVSGEELPAESVQDGYQLRFFIVVSSRPR